MQLLKNKNPYKNQEKILVAVDCIIFGFDSQQLKLLLFKRKVAPLKGAWSLIGAFVSENLSLNDTAKQVVFDLTGLNNIFLEELQIKGKNLIYYSLVFGGVIGNLIDRIFRGYVVDFIDVKIFNYNFASSPAMERGNVSELGAQMILESYRTQYRVRMDELFEKQLILKLKIKNHGTFFLPKVMNGVYDVRPEHLQQIYEEGKNSVRSNWIV